MALPRRGEGPATVPLSEPVASEASGEGEGRTPKDSLGNLVRVAAGCRRHLSASLSKSVTNRLRDVGAFGLCGEREGRTPKDHPIRGSRPISNRMPSPAFGLSLRECTERSSLASQLSHLVPFARICGLWGGALEVLATASRAGPGTSTTARPRTRSRTTTGS